MSNQHSRLLQDLYSAQRDVMYRAISFIALQGGPEAQGDDRNALEANRELAEQWLLLQDDKAISGKYGEFVQTWSPVFSD